MSKQIILNPEWKIVTDSMSTNLVRKVIKIHEKDKGKIKAGTEYEADELYFYPNIKVALQYFLLKYSGDSTSIQEVLDKIAEVEEKIEKLELC